MADNGKRALYGVHVVKDCDHDGILSVIHWHLKDHQEAAARRKTLLFGDSPQTLAQWGSTSIIYGLQMIW